MRCDANSIIRYAQTPGNELDLSVKPRKLLSGLTNVYLGTPFQFPARELTLFLVPLLTSQESRHLCSKNSSASSSCLMVILPVKKELEKQAACYQRGLG